MLTLILASVVITQTASDVTATPPATPSAGESKTSDTAVKPPQQVDTIVVKARPQTRDSRIDRVVYDVRTLPDAPASAAVDAIGLLPGVFVGANNRITMVGGAWVTVLVDGKSMPRAAALQIPANQIARIEVMSNPPAEFASSSQAVINIITKKAQEEDKLGGSIAANINTLDSQTISMSFNRGMKPWSFNGFLRATRNDNLFRSQSEGVSGIGASREEESRTSDGQFKSSDFNASLRAVRKLSSTDSLSLSSGYYSSDYLFQTDSIETRSLANSKTIIPIIASSQTLPSLQYHSIGFNSEKEDSYKFDLDVSFSKDQSKSVNESQRGAQKFSNQERKDETNFEFETSFEKTFKAGRVLSLGMSYGDEAYALDFSDIGFAGPGISQSNVFKAKAIDQAAYASFQFKLGKFGFQPGLRVEDTKIDWSDGAGLLSGTTAYQRVLPSLFITRALKTAGTLKASYSQGTTPGSLSELNPFRRSFDLYYAQEGNPKLEPADRQTFELTHEFEKNSLSVVTTAFYRDTRNEFSFGSRLIENNVVLATSVNLGRSESTGLGSTIKGKLGKKLNYSFNWEVSKISFSDPFLASGASRVEKIQSNGKASLDYKPNSLNQFVFATSFKSDEHRLGYTEEGYWENSIQYSRRLPKKVSLVVTATNIGVETDRFTRSFGPGFSSQSRRSNPSRALKIALSKTF